jgi:hypothetical protein
MKHVRCQNGADKTDWNVASRSQRVLSEMGRTVQSKVAVCRVDETRANYHEGRFPSDVIRVRLPH